MIAIAHRLSTIARMDRLVVLDRGPRRRAAARTPSCWPHGGTYARLWRRQSGGFLEEDQPTAVGAIPVAE